MARLARLQLARVGLKVSFLSASLPRVFLSRLQEDLQLPFVVQFSVRGYRSDDVIAICRRHVLVVLEVRAGARVPDLYTGTSPGAQPL